MPTRLAAGRLAVLSTLLVSSPLRSQAVSENTRVDLSAAIAYGGGGADVRDERFGLGGAGAITYRWRAAATRDHWLGVTGRQTRVIDNADDCQGVIGDCFARYPAMRAIGLLVGVGVADGSDANWRPLRVMAGPSYAQLGGGGGTVAADARVDVWLMRRRSASLTLVLETSVVPRWRGATWWTGSAGLGIGTRW